MKKWFLIICSVFMILSVVVSAAEVTAEIKAGDIVTFGTYPQTKKGKDKTPIEWVVLKTEDGKAMLLSRYVLDCKRYNDGNRKVTWEKCTLRKWLNKDFLKKAFSKEEQKAIQVTLVDNSKKQGGGEFCETLPGPDTEDRIYLLSFHEAYREFFQQEQALMAEPTDYAVAKGAEKFKADDPWFKTVGVYGNAGASWWLRTSGDTENSAVWANFDGTPNVNSVGLKNIGIRPVLWVSIDALR